MRNPVLAIWALVLFLAVLTALLRGQVGPDAEVKPLRRERAPLSLTGGKHDENEDRAMMDVLHLDRVLKAVRRLERADKEFSRAQDADEQPRLSKAGTAYVLAKWNLYRVAKKVTA